MKTRKLATAEHTATLFQRLHNLIEAQALDEGLWFQAKTAPEAYLQQELRAVHKASEDLIRAFYQFLEAKE